MFIGHAPSGYIMVSLLLKKFPASNISTTICLATGIFGALAPDLDLLYFFLVDHRQHLHHSYVTHFPLFWLGLLSLSAAWLGLANKNKYAALAFIFCLGGFVHMILDTIVGGIWWFAPFIDRSFSLFKVSSYYKPWWLNFILHWSFGLEFCLWIWAFLIYRKRGSVLR
jgi:hypothetical protein